MNRSASRARAGRRPTRWELEREADERARARNLAELMAELREARETGAEWYVWVASGRPLLTEAEYALVSRNARARGSSSEPARARAELEPRALPSYEQGELA